jgi:hypothetical protein
MARINAAIVILGLFFVLDESYRWWAIAGLVPLLTDLVGWCPAYRNFGVRTCSRW